MKLPLQHVPKLGAHLFDSFIFSWPYWLIADLLHDELTHLALLGAESQGAGCVTTHDSDMSLI